eukprot:TRINITY_DN5336_c1_g1_i1.p1 TRINITY_DN5336_c1_g1~~TRINITY_DN5336_c1_g1_i1.p1  ORF type:complete len:279 (-),score=93.44 TRINITY_DN5336_c1_g1_i1:87-923(-)
MAGLRRPGAKDGDVSSRVSPLYRSKYPDASLREAGAGVKTRTKPSLTLFVVGIPADQTSDSVAAVFEGDEGLVGCRPVGGKKRMVFVDYDSVSCATKAMQKHQGHVWEGSTGCLKIDYDKDERNKRSRAVDAGHHGKWKGFGRLSSKRRKRETEGELFARLKREAAEEAKDGSAAGAPAGEEALADAIAEAAMKRYRTSKTVKAVVKVKKAGSNAEADEAAPAAGKADGQKAAAEQQLGSLCGYASSASEDQEAEEEEEEEQEAEDESSEEESDETDD